MTRSDMTDRIVICYSSLFERAGFPTARRSFERRGRMSVRPGERIRAVNQTGYRFFLPFDFLEPDGITLATVLAMELAIFATTPFLELRFFAPVVFLDLVFVALLVFDFGLVVAAFLAIINFGTASPLQIT